MRQDVHPFALELPHLALRRRYHDRRIRGLHKLNRCLRLLLVRLAQTGQFGFQLVETGLPMSLDLGVHSQCGEAVNADHHALPQMPPAHEMLDQIAGNRLQPVLAGNQMVFPGERPLQLLLLRLVQFGLYQQRFHVLVQVLVRQLQLGNAVLVVERHRRPVVYALLEVVDRDVIAEHLARLLFACNQRRTSEPNEGGIRQGQAHVHRQCIVLAAVRLVGNDDDV